MAHGTGLPTFAVRSIGHLTCMYIIIHQYTLLQVSSFKLAFSLGCNLSSESPCMAAHVGTCNFPAPLRITNLILPPGMSETCSHEVEPGTNASSIIAANGAFSLENILGEDHDAVQHLAARVAPTTRWDEEDIERPLIEGYCIECEGNFYQ